MPTDGDTYLGLRWNKTSAIIMTGSLLAFGIYGSEESSAITPSCTTPQLESAGYPMSRLVRALPKAGDISSSISFLDVTRHTQDS